MENDRKPCPQEHLEALTKALAECSAEEICAAISLLPDYREDGIVIAFAATARIIMENFQEDAYETVLEGIKGLIEQLKTEQK